VYRGGHPQTNLVLVKGRQAVIMVVMKSGEASRRWTWFRVWH
jgi:hypothetical protein